MQDEPNTFSNAPAPPLVQVDNGLSAQPLADQAFAIWRQIELCLSALVGERAVHALYQRSLHLNLADHAWLASLHVSNAPVGPADFFALREALSQQAAPAAAAANNALLSTLRELLEGLIGGSLTERLLGPFWPPLARASST